MCASAVSFETLYTSWKDEVHKIGESDEQSKRVEQSKKEQKCNGYRRNYTLVDPC